MAKLLYQGQNISRAPKEKSAWTSPTTVLTGDTTVTIYDSRIKSSSIIKKYVEPFSDGEILGVSNIQITDGQAVLTFSSAAKANTTIKLEIMDAEGFKEVTLWENPSPTSAFANQTVTLSDSLDNYNYIAISYIYTSATPATDASVALMSVEDFKKGAYNTSIGRQAFGLTIANTSNQPLTRSVYYVSSTSVRFGVCYKGGVEESTTNGANPLKITGLTELNQVKIRNAKIENVLWTNPSPSTSTGFPNSDVTLSQGLSNFDSFRVVFGYAYNNYTGENNTFSSTYNVEEFKKCIAPATYGFSGVLNVTHRSNGNFYDRRLVYASDITITFGSCYQYKPNATAAVSNIFVIPLQIIGIKEVSTHKADIYGAAQDTIYYSTNGTDWTVVGQTDSNGYLANAVLPDTAFILKSSVAKNPEDLTADYTKAFNTDSNVLRFMPDNCLYWYGYENAQFEKQNVSYITVTKNTNDFRIYVADGSTYYYYQTVESQKIANKKVNLIVKSATLSAYNGNKKIWWDIGNLTDKTICYASAISTSRLYTQTPTTDGMIKFKAQAMSGGTASIYISALWYE
jgi:hypothetical protein